MNRPSIGVRFAGSRLGALVLLGFCVWGVVAWYQGNASQWLMMAALMAGLWTLKCIARMRVYRAWAAEWEAMGAEGAPARAIVKKRHILRWCWLLALAVAVVVLQAGGRSAALNQAGAADIVFLAVLALLSPGRLLLRRGRRKAGADSRRGKAAAEVAPVAWMMGRASSSPSRGEAARNVPDYCAGLLKGVGG
jgi:endonuclease/exonuclease/phosphatase (EEP) superfamily protein YafD